VDVAVFITLQTPSEDWAVHLALFGLCRRPTIMVVLQLAEELSILLSLQLVCKCSIQADPGSLGPFFFSLYTLFLRSFLVIFGKVCLVSMHVILYVVR
jgi:hypothetical protein